MELEGVKVKVCSIDGLITMKNISARDKDLADIEQLTKIKEYEKEWPVTFVKGDGGMNKWGQALRFTLCEL